MDTRILMPRAICPYLLIRLALHVHPCPRRCACVSKRLASHVQSALSASIRPGPIRLLAVRPNRQPPAAPRTTSAGPPTRHTPFLGARTVPPSLPTPPDSSNNMKHVQHETLECDIHLKTDETSRTYTYNIYGKHMQHSDKHLQHKNTYYNIRLKQMKYLKHMCETYATSRSKWLQHMSGTHETF